MKLVVGLGNPERKYQGTRHNIGFAVAAKLAETLGAGRPKSKFHAHLVEAELDGEKILLLSPLTYMNRSGISVQEACNFYRLPHENLLVVCDDFNLPLAKLRFRASGSSGGQKGLEDIMKRLGTEEFARLRIGVDAPPEGVAAADYVLSPFRKEEIPNMEDAVHRAEDAVMAWLRHGIDACMNLYNA